MQLGDDLHKINVYFFPVAATVEFAQPQYSVLETGGSVTVTLNLTGILDQNTTVRYVDANRN